jgi:cyclopropane fatty-acyl-phospholipid synthase-like methyltransferase
VSNINDLFFQGQYKEIWRQIIPPGLTEAETDFIEEIACLKKDDNVLDAMCGYGRHSLELARRGYRVTAIDIEAPYINEIREMAGAENLPVNAITGSVKTGIPAGHYDAVICMGNSFAFFNEEEVKDILQSLAGKIKTGGKLIINSWMIAEIAIRHFKEKEWHEMKGFRYLISSRYLFNPARIESTHIILDKKGQVEEIRGVDYIFTISELQNLLSQCGFSLEEVFSTPRKKGFTIGDGRAYIVAERS